MNDTIQRRQEDMKLDQRRLSNGIRFSLKWWKDTGVILGLMGIIYLAMRIFTNQYLTSSQNQSSCVVTVCYLALVVLCVLLFLHIFYPGSFRRTVAVVITAIVNKGGQTVPPKVIMKSMGVDSDVDKDTVNIAKSKMPECQATGHKPSIDQTTLDWLHEIDPDVSSLESFFDKVGQKGATQFYPIIRKLIQTEKSKKGDFYHLMYELVSMVDTSINNDERTYRKENLRYLITLDGDWDKWNFCCTYIDICYKDEDYGAIIDFAQKIIAVIDDSDKKCSARRSYVYIHLGSIYMEMKQYDLAIPYLKEVVRISSVTLPALYRLAHLYANVLRDYEKGLYYSQLCFSKLSDENGDKSFSYMEVRLIRWIAYCSAACGEFDKGCVTLENYLKVATIPFDERAYLEACLAYFDLKVGKYGKASSLVIGVLERDPMNITAVNVKGMLEMRNGNYDIAINCFTNIIHHFEEEKTLQARYYAGEIYNNLAICEARTGKREAADKHFREAFNHGYPDVAVSQFAKVALNPLVELGNNTEGFKLPNGMLKGVDGDIK